MFFRRRPKAPTSQILDDLAKTIELVDALVEQEKATGREVNGGPRPVSALPRLEARLHAVTAD
jgi:hypothetical protein